jgi:hypothetical protein
MPPFTFKSREVIQAVSEHERKHHPAFGVPLNAVPGLDTDARFLFQTLTNTDDPEKFQLLRLDENTMDPKFTLVSNGTDKVTWKILVVFMVELHAHLRLAKKYNTSKPFEMTKLPATTAGHLSKVFDINATLEAKLLVTDETRAVISTAVNLYVQLDGEAKAVAFLAGTFTLFLLLYASFVSVLLLSHH